MNKKEKEQIYRVIDRLNMEINRVISRSSDLCRKVESFKKEIDKIRNILSQGNQPVKLNLAKALKDTTDRDIERLGEHINKLLNQQDFFDFLEDDYVIFSPEKSELGWFEDKEDFEGNEAKEVMDIFEYFGIPRTLKKEVKE